MAEPEPIVTVRDLHKQYETVTAVDGVSFDIRAGEVFGLLGPNGAGKTTTIGILAGTLAATSGDVRVAGFDARASVPAMRMALGVVPQELSIYSKLTGRENLDFFGSLYNMRGASLSERVTAMLDMVGLTDRADDRSADYSGGMKRRLNLAVGLMHNPQLLLLDEPTVGVDPQSRNHIFEGVRSLNRKGLTVLYTSHYMEEVQALCDRVGIMDRGKMIACDTVPNLIASLGGSMIDAGIGRTNALEEIMAELRCNSLIRDVEVTSADAATEDSAEENPDVLHVRTELPNRVLPLLIGALTAHNVALHSLNIREPNLEDVFLTLTGKTLRD